MDIQLIEENKKKYIIIKAELLAKPEESKSGKSLVLASTKGNVKTDAKFNGRDVVVGLNVYVKRETA